METKGGEVRRLHILYFLSHMGGHTEPPHLIRVLHLTRNGVYLRDIKRWLGQKRGTQLPEEYAWSYKRRYKSGYVWQDLMDDDLITPISDNEYVLKGSQIHHTKIESSSLDEKKDDTVILAEKKSPQVQVEEDKQNHKQQLSSVLEEESQIQQDISQDSSVFNSDKSSVTDDDSSKVEEEKLLETGKEGFDGKNHKTFSSPSLYHNMLTKNGSKNDQYKTGTPDSSVSTASSSSSQSSFTKTRGNSTRVSNVFRNWISCSGTVDTNDAALVTKKSDNRTISKEPNNMLEKRAEICKGDKLGGSARCFGTPWNYHDHNENYGARKSCDGEETNRSRKKLSELMNQTPFGGPFCSQCGKSFKPEKMHKHMKSCKGRKAMGTSARTNAEETHLQRSTSSYKDYLLKK